MQQKQQQAANKQTAQHHNKEFVCTKPVTKYHPQIPTAHTYRMYPFSCSDVMPSSIFACLCAAQYTQETNYFAVHSKKKKQCMMQFGIIDFSTAAPLIIVVADCKDLYFKDI